MSKDKNNNAKKQIKIDSTEQPPTPIITLCKKSYFNLWEIIMQDRKGIGTQASFLVAK